MAVFRSLLATSKMQNIINSPIEHTIAYHIL